MIGTVVSHYKILEELGGGGMGVVYKAQDLKLDRLVALKFLPPDLTRDPEVNQRFIHEAKAAAALQHTNVCVVHDIDQAPDGRMFISMEYLEGETLRKMIERGPLEINDAVGITVQVAQGLVKAHEHGIVHRDIKPANILVTSDGIPKIVDFGVAKLAGQSVLTRTGSTLGTIAYMSPEQARGESVDGRTDVWALGVILYEMLTGQRPFKGDYDTAVLYSILNASPEPVTALRTDVPVDLEEIVTKCLEKDQANRYQHVDELVVDLRRARGDTSRGISAVSSIRHSASRISRGGWLKHIALMGAAVILVAASVALYFLWRPESVRLNPNYTIRMLYSCQYQLAGDKSLYFVYPDISRDGNWVSFGVPDDSGYSDLYFMNVFWREPRKIPVHDPRWLASTRISPNGEFIGFGGGNSPLRLISSNGAETRVMDEQAFGGLEWLPDGSRISYLAGEEPGWHIWSEGRDGSDRRLEWVDTVRGRSMFHAIAYCWSPDGASIGWVREFDGPFTELFAVDPRTREERQLTFDRKIVDEPVWLSSGIIVFMSDRSGRRGIWAIPQEGGDPRQVTVSSVEHLSVRISGDGKRMLVPEVDGVTEMWVTDFAGVNVPQIKLDFFAPAWSFGASGDFKRFAFAREEQPEGWALYVTDHQGKNRVRVAVSKRSIIFPRFSPDGKWIVYKDPEVSTDNVIVVPLGESGEPIRLTVPGLQYSVFSPLAWIDSLTFVVCTNERKSYLCSVRGGEPSQFFEDSTYARIILGGTHLMYRDYRSSREGMWVAELDSDRRVTGRAVRVLEPGVQLLSSAGGGTCLVQRPTGEVWKLTLPSGKQERIGMPPSFADLAFDQISNDGKRLAYCVDRVTLKLVLLENVFE